MPAFPAADAAEHMPSVDTKPESDSGVGAEHLRAQLLALRDEMCVRAARSAWPLLSGGA